MYRIKIALAACSLYLVVSVLSALYAAIPQDSVLLGTALSVLIVIAAIGVGLACSVFESATAPARKMPFWLNFGGRVIYMILFVSCVRLFDFPRGLPAVFLIGLTYASIFFTAPTATDSASADANG